MLHCPLQVSLRTVPTISSTINIPISLAHQYYFLTHFSCNHSFYASPRSRPRISPSLLSTTSTHYTIVLGTHHYSAGLGHSKTSCLLWSSLSHLPYFRSHLRLQHFCDAGPHPFPGLHPEAQSSVDTLTSTCTLLAIFSLPLLVW